MPQDSTRGPLRAAATSPPRPDFTSPREMPGRRDNLPAGALPPPHFDRQGDEQRQPSPEDLAETGRVQRELVPKPA